MRGDPPVPTPSLTFADVEGFLEHEFVGFGQGVVGVGEKFGGAAPGAPKKGLGDAKGGDHLPPAPPCGVFLGWGGAKWGEKQRKRLKR